MKESLRKNRSQSFVSVSLISFSLPQCLPFVLCSMLFALIKLPFRRFSSDPFIKTDRFRWTNLHTGSAWKTVRNDFISFQDGFHHSRRTTFHAVFAADASAIINLNPAITYLFQQPANQAKRTEKMTPETIDEQWKKHDQSYENHS